MHTSLESSFSFKGWTYITAAITLAPKYFPQNSELNSTICFDISCRVIFINKYWLLKRLSNQKINIMSSSLKVRGIRASKYESSEFVALALYFPGKNGVGDLVYATLQYKIHLVESLHANLLIGNNIMSLKAMVINLGKKTVLIDACRVTIDINAKQWGQFLARKLLTSQNSVILAHSKAMIFLLKLLLFDN